MACRKIVLEAKGPQRREVLKKTKLNFYGLLTKLRAADVVTFVTACYIVM